MAKKILIAEDDVRMRELLRIRLEANDYRVSMVEDGFKMLSAIQKDVPDLIILDIMMAKMDGCSALRALRRNEISRFIPVIILTGYDDMEEFFEGEDISAYITKPFNEKDLLDKIAKAIK